MHRPAALLIAFVVVCTRESPVWASDAEPRLVAQVVASNGLSRTQSLDDLNGHLLAPAGSEVRLAVDPRCTTCKAAKVLSLNLAGKPIGSYANRNLPVSLVGDGLPLAVPGTIVVEVEITKTDDTAFKGDYTVRYDLFPDEGWWTVADTVAYAVTRQQGNTAIAGAGVFFDLPHWKFLSKTKGIFRWSVVVHLLPPVAKDEPADIGIAPLGFSLFGNRVVAGIGWNISRQGLRPEEHNRYVYVGFSASQILKPER